MPIAEPLKAACCHHVRTSPEVWQGDDVCSQGAVSSQGARLGQLHVVVPVNLHTVTGAQTGLSFDLISTIATVHNLKDTQKHPYTAYTQGCNRRPITMRQVERASKDSAHTSTSSSKAGLQCETVSRC